MPDTKTIKRQQKKQQKELKRRKRQKQDAVRRDQWQRVCRFPKFEVSEESTANPVFIDAVLDAANRVNFDNQSHFQKLDHLFWEVMARDGFQGLQEIWKRGNQVFGKTSPDSGDSMRSLSFSKLAEAIYSKLPSSIKGRFMPHNFFVVQPKGKTLQLCCNSLISKPTSRGNIHFSFYSPFLESPDGKRMLGFSSHALQRICERIAPRWKTNFAELAQFLRFVAFVPPFEMTCLQGGQTAIVLFAVCRNLHSNIHDIYVNEILGVRISMHVVTILIIAWDTAQSNLMVHLR